MNVTNDVPSQTQSFRVMLGQHDDIMFNLAVTMSFPISICLSCSINFTNDAPSLSTKL